MNITTTTHPAPVYFFDKVSRATALQLLRVAGDSEQYAGTDRAQRRVMICQALQMPDFLVCSDTTSEMFVLCQEYATIMFNEG